MEETAVQPLNQKWQQSETLHGRMKTPQWSTNLILSNKEEETQCHLAVTILQCKESLLNY